MNSKNRKVPAGSPPRDDWKRVGSTLRAFRELRGFSVDELATQIGYSRPYLANIEDGRKKLTNRILSRAAHALQIPQKAIMNAEDVKNYFAEEDRAA